METLSKSLIDDYREEIPKELFQRQLDLEREIEENGAHNIQKFVDNAKEKGQVSNTLYGNILLKNGLDS